ncbi:MAG: sigma 54-interacting transcriptional regulator [Candidatus Hinthialibacter antarcticus]|nr:sigma 54-interacting transcriptional regulator [Candidatus Hinthialibacter antarcticus]
MKPISFKRFAIIGDSPVMKTLEAQVRTAAACNETILLTGERGVGKELIAKALHKLSANKGGPFITVDCAALHAATAESVLFGHERGAFTGAVHRHIGLLEQAHQGSVFLDEIASLSLEMQGRFLRFLEERTIQRIGSTQPLQIRTRVIAAANRDLVQEQQAGRFLPDLYDRLNVIRLHAPPLRERSEDALQLFHHFLPRYNGRLLADGQRFLLDYPWPGNVRELRNLCKRIAVFYPEGPIDKTTLENLIDPAPVEQANRASPT